MRIGRLKKIFCVERTVPKNRGCLPCKRYIILPILIFLLFWMTIEESCLATGTDQNLSFKDSSDAQWAIQSIGKMKYRSIINGYDDGYFRPNQSVTRVEAIIMAVRIMGLEEEAKTKSVMDTLPFTDASVIDSEYAWAKGYISIALEKEVLLPTEYTLNPDQPATRAWVTVLLLRALELGFLAYERRDVQPEFSDAETFPTISYGYVAVALENGIISGYPDGTFKPNKEVTRAEMASLLERTDNLKWERKFAHKHAGTIHSIQFDTGGKGTIILDHYGSSSGTYEIPSDLPISYQNGFIKASDLKVNDDVILLVQPDKIVMDGAYVDRSIIDKSTANMIGFKLQLKLHNGEKFKLSYSYENGIVIANIEGNLNGKVTKVSDEESIRIVRELLMKVDFHTAKDLDSYNPILKALGVEQKSLAELNLRVDFAEGGYWGFKWN